MDQTLLDNCDDYITFIVYFLNVVKSYMQKMSIFLKSSVD